MKNLSDNQRVMLALAGVLAISALLHFAWFFYPMTVVLDEVHYGRFAMASLRHEYFFDLHPPLGKLMYWAVGAMTGLDPAFTFPGNQLPLPDSSYLVLRALPRLVGTAFPLVMFGVAREVGMSMRAALLVALLVVFENATQLLSQFVFIDIFLLFFGFSSVWAYLRYRRTQAWQMLVLASVASGCAIATKWTGLSFVALIGCMELFSFMKRPRWVAVRAMMVIGVVPVLVYVGTFALLFAVITQYSDAAAPMSPGFRAALVGSPEQVANVSAGGPRVEPASFLARFLELNRSMFEASHHMQSEHPYGTKWYNWPFMSRGLDFWADYRSVPEDGVAPGTMNRFARIMLLGNPVVWWASTFAIFLLLINLPAQLLAWATRRSLPDGTILFLCGAYALNMLPFMGIARVMFLYHYMSALMFAVLALCWQLDRARDRRWLMPTLLAAAVAAFMFFAPLTYGLHLSQAASDARFWFESWR